MKIIILPDGDGCIATIEGYSNIYAFGYSESEAKKELLNVVDMMIDYNLEQVKKEKQIKKDLINSLKIEKYAL